MKNVIFFCLFFGVSITCFAQVEVWQYEKIGSPYYLCTVMVHSRDNGPKMLAIEHKNGTVYYTKEEALRWIEAIEKALQVKVSESSEAKTEVTAMLPKSTTFFVNGKKRSEYLF